MAYTSFPSQLKKHTVALVIYEISYPDECISMLVKVSDVIFCFKHAGQHGGRVSACSPVCHYLGYCVMRGNKYTLHPKWYAFLTTCRFVCSKTPDHYDEGRLKISATIHSDRKEIKAWSPLLSAALPHTVLSLSQPSVQRAIYIICWRIIAIAVSVKNR